MIHFFRNLRRDLFSQNRITKYILYATGEIFLVVIGILIAIQINNLNEHKKSAVKVKNYLVNLKAALLDDIASLESTIGFNTIRLNGIFYILKNANLNTDTFTEVRWTPMDKNISNHDIWPGPFPETIDNSFTIVAFNLIGRGFGGASFNESVINELYSTGTFSDIFNQELKNKISEYYKYLSQRLEGYAIEEHEEWANETTRFFRDEYDIFTLDVTKEEKIFERLKGKKDVENYLRYLALEINYHCIWSENAKNLASELVKLIDVELHN